MVAILTTLLTNLVEISNIFIVITVITLTIFMTYFITRLQINDIFGPSVVYVNNATKVQVALQKVEVPFTLQIINPISSSYKEIKLQVSGKPPYSLQAFWGMSSVYLYKLLSMHWNQFYEDVVQTRNSECFHSCQTREFIRDDNDIQLGLDEHLELGPPTREKFPLVVILNRKSLDNSDLTNVGARIYVIHLKDSTMNHSTNIMYEYLKQYSGQFSLLSSLYTQDLSQNDSSDAVCVVCWNYPVSRALLPCRHLCVCGACFKKIENCPMCRAHISSYFVTSPEPKYPQDQVPKKKTSWWSQITHYFDDFVAFDR